MLILPQFIYRWILEYYNDYNHNNDCREEVAQEVAQVSRVPPVLPRVPSY